jgi:stage III sporulation protein AC
MGMNIDLIFKIAAVGILVAVLNIILKQSQREEMAMMTTLAGIVIVLLMVIDLISRLFQNVKTIFQLY